LVDLFHESKYNNDLIIKLKKNLFLLKQLDNKKYKETITFIDQIYKTIIFNNHIEDDIALKNFLSLKSDNNLKKVLNFIKIKKIYYNYDYQQFKKF
jgi:hypothetical protein